MLPRKILFGLLEINTTIEGFNLEMMLRFKSGQWMTFKIIVEIRNAPIGA